MSFVVSANYREYGKGTWLVRKEDEPIEKCEEQEITVATDFFLDRPVDGEDGFGCKTVAICQSVIEEMSLREFCDLKAKLIKIKFNGYDAFEEELSRLPVKRGKYLLLDGTGMYYMPVDEQAA